ncbi:MAG TPA: flotillin family protein [Luteimonas sp.]|nr:flotillin family protein [Luteimonas sp.]HRP72361.1 flotillin family protein [Luteimonas sp.]
MELALLGPFLIGAIGVAVLLVVLSIIFKAFYKKVDQGTALIVNDMSSTPKVHFTGALIIPVLYRAELMKISLITLQVDRRGKEGLICRDNMRADIAVAFYLRVNETQADVLRVAKALGADRASDKHAVDELFNAKFSEALKTVGKKFDFTDLFEKRQEFRDEIVKVIGNDLNGYVLEDVAIDYLEQTPKNLLDPSNILDAEGIRKITELTASQNVITNELSQNEHLAITKKNVETREATLALERQQAEAEARQKREIETIQARESAETQKVQEEQRLVAEQARIEAQQLIDIRDQNRMREVEVAEQNRERAVAIEAERVARARQLELVTTDREVQLQGVERDKVVEQGKMDVANITRERIAIDKTVAQEEERIKEVREVSEADRLKQVAILDAEARAQQALLEAVKKAEADETAAKHKAVEITTLAQAELEAASRQAEAKKALAEGVRAERAAPGLADAQVKEAGAVAIEKVGIAEARVVDVMADANLKQGAAEAKVLAEKMGAQAQGEEQLGRAKAAATESIGLAEATVVEKKLFAEAEGLTKKFLAIDALSENARSHEEYRMALDTSLKQALASIEAGKEISKENAEMVATALRNADIDMVGGDGGMFDSLVRAISIGKSIEGLTDKSPVVQELMQKYLGIDRGKALPKVDGDAA